MKQFCLAFTLNTEEIRVTLENDYNVYFALQYFTSKRLKEMHKKFNKDVSNIEFPSELATAMFENAIEMGFDMESLKEHESVVSAFFSEFKICDPNTMKVYINS